MRVEFLIVCKREEAAVDFLQELIMDALVGTDDEDIQIEVQLSIARPVQASNNTEKTRAICGFSVQFVDNPAQPHEVVTAIIDALKGLTDCHVLKFYDDILIEDHIRYYREVFELEMRLRKAISLVYLTASEGLYYDLLREDVMQIAAPKDEKPKKSDMEVVSENEFFHLVFSQYIQLNRRKTLKVEDVLTMITDSSNYDEFRDEITRQPIQDKGDRAFLASLTKLLDPIEKLRNGVAHNRTLSENMRENYTQAHAKLSEAIDSFLNAFPPTAPDSEDSSDAASRE